MLLNVYSSSPFVVQFCLAHLYVVQFWFALPRIDSNVAWFILKSSFVLVFILVVLSPVSRVSSRHLVSLLGSLHQCSFTAYPWFELSLSYRFGFFSVFRYCLLPVFETSRCFNSTP